MYGAVLAGLLIGCGPSKKELEEKAAALMAEEKKQAQARAAQVREEFQTATDAQLRSMVGDCKSAILKRAAERYKPFSPYLVDEWSADSIQATTYLSGGRPSKDADDPIKHLRAEQKKRPDKSVNPHDLSMRFSVMVVKDSFSGPQREVKTFSCYPAPGLTVEASVF